MIFLFTAIVGTLLAASYLTIYWFMVREIKLQYDKRLVAVATPIAAAVGMKPIGGEALDRETVGPDRLYLDSFEPESLALKYVELLDRSRRVLQRSHTLQERVLTIDARRLPSTEPTFAMIDGGSLGPLRAVLVPFEQAKQPRFLLLAATTRCSERVIARIRMLLLLLFAPSLLLTYLASAWYTRRSLAPLTDLTRRAREMSEQVSQPTRLALWTLPVENPHDELGRLSETFNLLAERVQVVLRQLRQFVSDASHELRTPLTVLQGEAELLLAEPRTVRQYQQAIVAMKEELRKLNRMVEGLFTLSMADAGQLRLLREPVYLNEILEESCALAVPLARAKDITIERNLRAEVPYLGDESFLRELFLIFLDNAVKHAPRCTLVQVDLRWKEGEVEVRFSDNGPGIAPEHLPHIFERFYRASHRSDGELHSGGLGLAIAQAIVQACSGTVQCRTALRQGCTFIVRLPVDKDAMRPLETNFTEGILDDTLEPEESQIVPAVPTAAR
jgi:signal transduction histidine kinase